MHETLDLFHDERDETTVAALAVKSYDTLLQYSRKMTEYTEFVEKVSKKDIAHSQKDEEPTLIHYKKQMSSVSNTQFSPAIYLEALLDEVAQNTHPIDHPVSLEEVFA